MKHGSILLALSLWILQLISPINVLANSSIIQTVGASPVAVCSLEPWQIDLSTDGTAFVTVDDIDNGSYDEDGEVSLSIARADADSDGDGFPEPEDFGETVLLTITDTTSIVEFVLLVEDEDGNTDFCTHSAFISQGDVGVVMEIELDCRSGLGASLYDFDAPYDISIEELTNLLASGQLGNIPLLDDACNIVEASVIEVEFNLSFDACFTPAIYYNFDFTDACGNVSPTNRGKIIINKPPVDWTLQFPSDIVIFQDEGEEIVVPEATTLEDIVIDDSCIKWSLYTREDIVEYDDLVYYDIIRSYQFTNECTHPTIAYHRPALVDRPNDLVMNQIALSIRHTDLNQDGINDLDDLDGDADAYNTTSAPNDADYVIIEEPSHTSSPYYELISNFTNTTQYYVSAQAHGQFIYKQIIRVYNQDAIENCEEDITPPNIDCSGRIQYMVDASTTLVLDASALNDNTFDNCTPQNEIRYTFADPRLYPDSTTRTFDCDEHAILTQLIELWAEDASGNLSNCFTLLDIFYPAFCEEEIGNDVILDFQGEFIEDTTPSEYCVDVTAANFNNIISTNFSLFWDTTGISLLAIQDLNPALTAFSESNFDLQENAEGLLHVNWSNPDATGISLSEESILFRLCFQYTILPSPKLMLVPCLSTPEAVTNDGITVNIKSPAMTIEPCIEDRHEENVEFTISDTIVSIHDKQICVPIRVRNFNDIGGIGFTIHWDDTVLKLHHTHINQHYIDLGNFYQDRPRPYSIRDSISYLLYDPIVRTTLADDAILGEICFENLATTTTETLVYFTTDSLSIFTPTIDAVAITQDGLITILGDEEFVYPGDANANMQADHFDLLNVGLGYGEQGSPRENASINWRPELAEDWENFTPETNVNYKHADTNGDGTIDDSDILAIIQNWGEMPGLANSRNQLFSSREGIPLFVSEEGTQAGEQFVFPILLGTEEIPAENAYGIAFSINYEEEINIENPDWLSVRAANSWLGNVAEELLFVQRHFPADNRIDVAITRKNGQARDGVGPIAYIGIGVEDLILKSVETDSNWYEILFDISNVRLINAMEQEQDVDTHENLIRIQLEENTTTSTQQLEATTAVQIYPNPVREHLYIQSDDKIERIVIYAIDGRVIHTQEQASECIDVTQMQAGIYLLEVTTTIGVRAKRFSIQ